MSQFHYAAEKQFSQLNLFFRMRTLPKRTNTTHFWTEHSIRMGICFTQLWTRSISAQWIFFYYLWPTSLTLSLSLWQKCRSVFSLMMKTIMMKHAAWALSPVIWVKHPLMLTDSIVADVCGKQIGDKCGHWDTALWNGAVMSIYLMSSLMECFLSVTHCTNTACATIMNFISTENMCALWQTFKHQSKHHSPQKQLFPAGH